jgi:hypothetical protein
VTARARTALSALAMLGLATGALAWGWYAIEREGEREADAKRREESVFSFAAADVREVVVRAKGDETRLVRDGDGWRIAAPVEAPADAYAARTLVDRLAGLRRTREAAPPGGDLAPFGLASPRVTIEVRLDGGRTETLAVGDSSAFDGSVFVRPTSGAVLVAPRETRWALERGTDDLRAKPPPAAAAEKPVDPATKSP